MKGRVSEVVFHPPYLRAVCSPPLQKSHGVGVRFEADLRELRKKVGRILQHTLVSWTSSYSAILYSEYLLLR